MRTSRLLVPCFLVAALSCTAQPIELTTQEAKNLYKNITMRRASIHDPSIVYEESSKRYYIFGTHKAGAWTIDLQNWTQANPKWKVGSNTDAANKDAFVTPAVKKVYKGDKEIDFPQFNAVDWSGRTDNGYNVDGNMWAPDVLWNPTMQKWCMYLSINGNDWHSSIILLTADKITGPWEYQGPVVISGFDNGSHSYKDTDVELVLGTLSSLPTRYDSPWAHTSKPSLPNNIDPCVFFDEEGKLWMAYGSWSGGIFMLELNEETGLRDYDVTYSTSGGDPYFGKRIAGGYYVSGEGAYIEHIGNYYYLFVTYGYLSSDGGYEMRVFRSENPDGPYVDGLNRPAIFTSYVMNYGTNGDKRGEKLMGSYNQWGFQTVGELAQGHNSIIAANDGRTYLVYHTRFNNDTEGFQERVHQVFVNEKGWLVAAPFEYNGETQTDEQNATQQLYQASEVPGKWQLLVHKYGMDYKNKEEVLPIEIELLEDGTITGNAKGKWSLTEGTTYIHLTIDGTTYYGVLTEQQMEPTTIKALCFTAAALSGVNVWGYKVREKYQLARQMNSQTLPPATTRRISGSIDLLDVDLLPNVSLQWTSSMPEVVSEEGRYNPSGLQEDTSLELTAHETCGDYFWTRTYNVTALKDTIPDCDYKSGMLAYYNFDGEPIENMLNTTQVATLKRNTPAEKPVLEAGGIRNGKVLHQFSTTTENRYSYVEMVNPLFGEDLDEGATIAFWVKPNDDNLWNCIWAFYNVSKKTRFFMTPNAYLGYNDGTNYIDINYAERATHYLTPQKWNHVAITFSRSNGISIYVNGALKASSAYTYRGHVGDADIAKKADVDFSLFLNFMQECPKFYLGYGAFWSSADMLLDDLMLYNRVLTATETGGLYMLANRVHDFTTDLTSGIEIVQQFNGSTVQQFFLHRRYESGKAERNNIYDLQGRIQRNKVTRSQGNMLRKGVYIFNRKKIVVQ